MLTDAWSDERLDDLARALEPLPVKVAQLSEGTEHLSHELELLRADLTGDALAAQEQLAALQRQLVQMAWGLAVALLGAVTALLAAIL